ncbi:uncharacterized protein LOC143824281 [Paroedura picta]|uniref:uncharacterized protein LOC143824281 n=1 Tax=Paroedura picta TaxID=143630 RepID=UPI004055F4F2
MEATSKLIGGRILLLLLLLHSSIGRPQLAKARPDFIENTCHSTLFRMKLDKSFLQGKFFRVDIIDPSGATVPLDEELAARCGYVLSEDTWGNPVFRASVLGCHVTNEVDQRFSLNVNIRVSSFQDMRTATTYRNSMSCSYSPWAPREIVCEENYMEVSVKTNVPVISDDETEEWMSALPEAQKVVYHIWRLVFYSPSGRKTTVVSDAGKLGYGFNNTLARVFLRSPYSTNETDFSVVSGVTMSTVSSTSMYKQRWLLLLIDTTVSCPVDGISFTDTTLTWTVPSIIPKLVLQEPTFASQNVSMGIDGQIIQNLEEFGYAMEHNASHIEITIPIGASGGRLQSTVSNGVYGMIYSINLMLEHTWTDTAWQLTKYTAIKPITTPFMSQMPTVVNNTVPDSRLFSLAFGVFLPDVTLVALTIGGEPLSPEEANQKGYNVHESPFPNGTKSFNLEVPFDDPNVLKEYVNRNETRYHLLVNYNLDVGPGRMPYLHPADIECTVADIELPEGAGHCDGENMYLAISASGLYQHWSLYVGNSLLDQATALANGYQIATNDTHIVLQVPLFSVGIIYEVVSLERIQARFDLALKKTKTMETLDIFSVRCSYHSSEFIVCYPNGTIAVSAFMKTIPSVDMGKTRLKDIACKPKDFTKEQAFFQFHVSSCGTSLRFEGEHLIYENEISFEKETLPVQGPPMITRDPEYRLTILCYYPTEETLMQRASFDGSSPSSVHPPFGYGTMMVRSSTAGSRRVTQVLNVDLNVFKDRSFTERYEPHSTVVKYSWEPIFIEAELRNEAPDVGLYWENCWASESKEFVSTPQWSLIADGCKDRNHWSVLDFHPVRRNDRVKHPNHFKRLGIQLLIPLREVYFHCTVSTSICLHAPGNAVSCREQCPSQRPGWHSEPHPVLHGYVRTGPVYFTHL